jgi:tRNA-splicing ligase RtcB
MSIDELYEAGFCVPVKTWLPREEIEPGALDQLRDAATHPDVSTLIAVMPDCHVGFGVTIGSVFPTEAAVVPNAVGVDIGCGVCAVNTGIAYDRERMDKLFWRDWSGRVARNVPTGFGVHKQAQPLGPLDRQLHAAELQPLLKEKAAHQLGTLGGGNHFLEAQYDESDTIWLMVHSGSRHTGLRIAGYYHDWAIEISRRRDVEVQKDLSSLPLDDPIGRQYLEDMEWATDFALESRRRMVEQMVQAFVPASDLELNEENFINIHHNFARLEEHGGKQLMVHRKGATSAFDGQIGIIPGSMGTPTYIVRGRGNEESLMSCSHGAGRKMSRSAAKKAITDRDFSASLSETYSKASMSYVDEAPGAYKDISTVIERQLDLVEIVHTLRPIITLKGDSRAKED